MDFMPFETGILSYAQKAMETGSIVDIYEGAFWRANEWFSLFTGITLKDEMSLVREILAIDSAETVLDLACGPGLYSRDFSEKNPDSSVIAMDISWPMLRNGARKAQSQNLNNIYFIHGDAHVLPLKDQSIDAASCCAALHLIPDTKCVLEELYRVLKPGGHISASVFYNNMTPVMQMHSFFAKFFGGVHFFQKDELLDLFSSTGFEPDIYHRRGVWMVNGAVKKRE